MIKVPLGTKEVREVLSSLAGLFHLSVRQFQAINRWAIINLSLAGQKCG